MKTELKEIIKDSIDDCFRRGLLKETPLPEYVIEVPNRSEHGHFATNLPLALASSQKRAPRDIASIIVDHLRDEQGLIEQAEVAGPGFINFRIRSEKWYDTLSRIVALAHDYGRSTAGKDQSILVEFVSANPTGPLHLGHGRGAALGDTLCRILAFIGYGVVREFYINDAGQQIRLLGESIFSRWKRMSDPGYPFPEEGYHGEYVLDLARDISREIHLDRLPEREAVEICTQRGKEMVLDKIKHDLERFRVDFDVWAQESDLYGSGLLEDTLATLQAKNQIYENEGALWIRTADFGDDKDRVIQKRDGRFTYFASDISYHLEKRRRGFSRAINIWGADHHGYVPRLKAALSAEGVPQTWLSVMLIQLVKLWKDGQEIKMSKRAGNFVTLEELMDDVGVDAVRFVFLTKSHDTALDVDVDRVKRQDSENPVYYVQYAHARICSIFRKAHSRGISLPKRLDGIGEYLVLEEEMGLIRTMSEFPSLLQDICMTLEPHRLTYYLTELAALFHRYFNLGTKIPDHRIVTQNTALSQARLFLAESVRIVLANGLRLLGVQAPERM